MHTNRLQTKLSVFRWECNLAAVWGQMATGWSFSAGGANECSGNSHHDESELHLN